MANAKLWALGLAALVVVGGVAAYTFLYEGNVAVYVRDAPNGLYGHVYVNFTGVYVHEAGKANDSWTSLGVKPGSVDLESLSNTSAFLASLKLGPGHYTQLRIDVGSAYAVTATGVSVTLTVPSGTLKTDREFQVVSGKTTTLTADVRLNITGDVFTPVIGEVTVSTS